MQTEIVNLKKIISNKNIRLDVKYYQSIKKYEFFLKNKKICKFTNIVDITIPHKIKKDDLVFHNKGNSFKLEFAKQDIQNSNNNLVLKSKDNIFSESYISWYLSNDEIKNYLMLFSRGNVIFYISKNVFTNLYIIYPSNKEYPKTEVTIQNNSKFKEVIKIYLNEYNKNIEIENYLSASFLVGAICEALLYEILLDSGLSNNDLSNKKTVQLLDYIKIRGIDIDTKILNDFKEINKKRNLIHPERASKDIDKIYNLEKDIEPIFNRIVKEFGL